MAYKRAQWHSGLTYQQTCSGCQALVRYTDASLDFRPWFADGFVYCPRCKHPLRHNECYAIDENGNYINPQPVPAQQVAPQSVAPQQYAPQQYAPQQYAPQQYASQQYAPQPASEGEMVVCPNCGKKLAAGDKFCSACGTKLA